MIRSLLVFFLLFLVLEARELAQYHVFSHTQEETKKLKLVNTYLNTLPSVLLKEPKPLVLELNRPVLEIKKDLTYKLLELYDEQAEISTTRKWKDLSDWSSFLWHETANNQDPRAYASLDGLKNAQEDFLSFGLSYFLPPVTRVEASIKCRTPKKYVFFKDHFKDYISPLEQKDIVCLSMEEGFLSDLEFIDPLNGQKIDMGPVSMDSVKGFELLYATPGTADASEIAGHLLLRIKLDNNPRATRLGLENPNDLVISFLANTKEEEKVYKKPFVQEECTKNWFNLVESGHSDFDAFKSMFQSLKGLSGGFITMMDRQRLGESIKHYTVEEDRNLLRYELHLSQEQKKELLQTLYLAKKNYNARYYFFPQNCASVLVKVVSKGIDDEEIFRWNPIVSPPNTLVSLFTRKGLASTVYPSFYSYRKKAYIAQDKISSFYQELENKSPELTWPEISNLFNRDVSSRMSFMNVLTGLCTEHIDLNQQCYELSNLIQEAEMAYGHKDMVCEKYTSPLSSEVRKLQEFLLTRLTEVKPFDTKSIIEKEYIPYEQSAYNEGVSRTQLLSYAVGVGHYRSNSEEDTVLRLSGSIEKQDMGSISNLAMQRGNFVRMGSLDIALGKDSNSDVKLKTWRASLLQIQKFQDRLETIPSYFSSAGSLGLGLSVLDFRGTQERDMVSGTLAGGKVLMNLFSSENNNDFVYLSLGLDIAHQEDSYYRQTGLQIPSSIHSLMSFGSKRQLQWKNGLEYRSSINDKLKDEVRFDTELTYQLGEYAKSLFLLKMSFSYDKLISEENLSSSFSYTQGRIGLEVNPW